MDGHIRQKRPRDLEEHEEDCESTEIKLALLASLHPHLSQDILLDALLNCNGSVKDASASLEPVDQTELPRKKPRTVGYQSSLSGIVKSNGQDTKMAIPRELTRKGQTLYLYSPEDVEHNTPCSIIHNFLSNDEADELLHELLHETPTFRKETFQLFDRTVESPHTMCFYVDSLEEARSQQTNYVYNGSHIPDVRKTLPHMRAVSSKVEAAVNKEINRRIREFYPNGEKLRFQSPKDWKPNASFVNCYDGGAESVGYHSDQLTYLGPRAVIGSLSLGVAREFRVRRIVPRDVRDKGANTSAADTQGQISIHLPHNSLLVMHAEMQEGWKHSIAPAAAIDPHPLAGNKRLNVTYRWYRESLHPKFTPRCKCNVPTVLRCVQKKAETRGRYMWMCHRNYTPGAQGCNYFAWAQFDDDGEPAWASDYKKPKG